ncbi:MAG: heavy metal-binding domain-containing protein [Aureibaculum sp.]|nr:heavy metal-binding domain-containing protein [Aureibaculum sp.]
MKKTILTLAIIIAVGFTFTSCKNDKKEEVKVEDVKTVVEQEMASNVVYQCPMDCEKGKSYTDKGNCPVCKMDLKSKEVNLDDDSEMNKDSTDHDGHDHQ